MVFVGHGLSKDFRVINLTIDPEQIIDTVDIYYLQYVAAARLRPWGSVCVQCVAQRQSTLPPILS